jgi:hypothetical protein
MFSASACAMTSPEFGLVGPSAIGTVRVFPIVTVNVHPIFDYSQAKASQLAFFTAGSSTSSSVPQNSSLQFRISPIHTGKIVLSEKALSVAQL